jgi:hypothetical protein
MVGVVILPSIIVESIDRFGASRAGIIYWQFHVKRDSLICPAGIVLYLAALARVCGIKM